MNVLETMRKRRSIRAFKDEPIARDLLEEILRDASGAPVCDQHAALGSAHGAG